MRTDRQTWRSQQSLFAILRKRLAMTFITGSVTKWRSYISYVSAVSQKSASVTPADTKQWSCIIKCDSLTQPLPSRKWRWTATLTERKVPSLPWRQFSNFDILHIKEFSYHNVHPQYNQSTCNQPWIMDLPEKLSVTQPATEFTTLYKPTAFTTEIYAAYHQARH
jgi:hypothetical protein